MTGFGKAVGEYNNKKIIVEAKSVNSKQLDLNVKIPSVYREKEIELRNEVIKILERGKIEINVYIESPDNGKAASVNSEQVKSYYNQFLTVAADLKIKNTDDLFTAIIRMPDVIKIEQQSIDETEWCVVMELFMEALQELDMSRIREGALLEKDFIWRIKLIDKLSKQTKPYEKKRIDNIRAKMKQSFAEYYKSEDIDKNRFEQEIIYYLEKIDFTEEKVRLANHLKYFLDTIKKEESAGKKLGFITQEIGREINTLGSKANEVNIQKIVIQMKDELEKIKEQLLNIL